MMSKAVCVGCRDRDIQIYELQQILTAFVEKPAGNAQLLIVLEQGEDIARQRTQLANYYQEIVRLRKLLGDLS